MGFSNNATIYAITCVPTGRVYVGMSTTSVRDRWRTHRSDLRCGRHKNRFLTAAWRKYGRSAFRFEILEQGAFDTVERERYWIVKLNAFAPVGFNFADPADASVQCVKRFIVTTPRGRELEVTNLHRFCRENGLCSPAMSRVVAAHMPSYKGWKARHADMPKEAWERKIQVLLRRRRAESKNWLYGYVIEGPRGGVYTVPVLEPWCLARGLDPGRLALTAVGKARQHHGYRARRAA